MKNLTVIMISQWQYLWKVLVFIYLPVALLFVAIGLLSNLFDQFTLDMFFLDSATVAELPFYTGFVPRLVGVLWSASLTVCIFMFVILKQSGRGFARASQFFLQMGIISAVILLDEIFQFHGEVAPKYLHINKIIVLAVYLMMMIFFIVSNWTQILSSEYLLFILTMGMFGTSIFLDILPLKALNVQLSWQQLRYCLEDGSKFAGIATWLVYLSRLAIRQFEVIQLHSKTSGSV